MKLRTAGMPEITPRTLKVVLLTSLTLIIKIVTFDLDEFKEVEMLNDVDLIDMEQDQNESEGVEMQSQSNQLNQRDIITIPS